MNGFSIFDDVIKFLVRPDTNNFYFDSSKDKLMLVLKIAITVYLMSLIASIPYFFFSKMDLIPIIKSKIQIDIETIRTYQPSQLIYYKLINLLILPTTMCYFYLTALDKFSKNKIKITLSFICSLMLFWIFKEYLIFPSDYFLQFVSEIGYKIVTTAIIYLILTPLTFRSVEFYWTNKFNVVFYTIIVIAGILNFPNFMYSEYNLLGVFLISIPASVMFILSAYVKIRIGLPESIILYSLFLINNLNVF